ncbi:unnamed protein product, partial [Musa banksii]
WQELQTCFIGRFMGSNAVFPPFLHPSCSDGPPPRMADTDGHLTVPSCPSTSMTRSIAGASRMTLVYIFRYRTPSISGLKRWRKDGCLLAARLVPLALAIVVEQVATVGLCTGGRTRRTP